MKLSRRTRKILQEIESLPATVEEMLPGRSSSLQRFVNTAGWVTAGLGAVALGLIVGRELRQRYKFNHQTPYDFYSHDGDQQEMEYSSVGI